MYDTPMTSSACWFLWSKQINVKNIQTTVDVKTDSPNFKC